MNPKPQFLEMNPYLQDQGIDEIKQIYNINNIVNLASNENPYGFSRNVREAIINEIPNLSSYPDCKAALLRRKLAKYLNIQQDNLVFSNGTDELIRIICRAFLGAGTNAVLSGLSFPQYKRNVVMEGADIHEVPHLNGRHHIEKMIEAVDADTRVIWICNPNNPTGEYVREQELENLLKSINQNILVVCDEAYYEYVEAKDFPNSIHLMEDYPNLVITRTFSKAYGLAALRIGYGIAHSDVIRILESAKETFNTSGLAQVAAAAALEDQNFIKECHKKNREELEHFYTFCWRYGLNYFPSQGNFIFIDMGKPTDKITDYLLSKGFIIRSGSNLGFPTSVRITIGTSKQNDDLMVHLSQFLGDYGSKVK
jgi:histidinol-phosphate aminotransferase